MPDDSLTVQFHIDLDAWVIEGDPAGPAGVAAWEAAGVYWAADWIEPERLVRCEVAADAVAAGSVTARRALGLVELLLGEAARQVVAGGRPTEARTEIVARGGGPATRRNAGWLAVALDELDAGYAGPSLVAADAFLLARRVGIDDLLTFDISTVDEVVDGLGPGFLDALATEDPAAFDLARAYGAVLAAEGLDPGGPLAPVTGEPVDADLGDIASRFDAIVGERAMAFLGSQTVVWCHGLPLGAVLGATASFPDGPRRVTVRASVGDLPAEQLHVQALRDDGGSLTVVATARLVPGHEPGELSAAVDWLATGAQRLRLVTDPADDPPPGLQPAREAMHWGREAARLARRFRIDPVDPERTVGPDDVAGDLWERSAFFWDRAGVADQAERARQRVEATIAPSPFLRDRPSVREIVERLVDGDPARSAVADTAQLLGFTDLAAEARVAAAVALLERGQTVGALAAAGRSARDFARLGDSAGLGRANAVVDEVDGTDR